MSAADLITPADAITVDEFLEMDLPRTCEWHLVDGTVVSVTHAHYPHVKVQRALYREFESVFAGRAEVYIEFGYRLNPREQPTRGRGSGQPGQRRRSIRHGHGA